MMIGVTGAGPWRGGTSDSLGSLRLVMSLIMIVATAIMIAGRATSGNLSDSLVDMLVKEAKVVGVAPSRIRLESYSKEGERDNGQEVISEIQDALYRLQAFGNENYTDPGSMEIARFGTREGVLRIVLRNSVRTQLEDRFEVPFTSHEIASSPARETYAPVYSSSPDRGDIPSWLFSLGVEGGGQGYDLKRSDPAGKAASYVTYLKSKGWYSATEEHSLDHRNDLKGLFARVALDSVSLEAGIRYFDMGSSSIIAHDEHPPQYIKITDVVSEHFRTPYLSVSCNMLRNREIGYSLIVEAGWALADWTAHYKEYGYNGNNFERHANLSATSRNGWYGLGLAVDYWFARHMSMRFFGGYKFLHFSRYTIDAVDTNFSSYKPGDVLLNTANGNYQQKLDGLFGGITISIDLG